MHLRSKAVAGIISSSLLIALCFVPGHYGLQAQDKPGQVQATPLPKDVDPNDPALPVWMRPSGGTSAAAATASSTPTPKAPSTAAPGEQPPPSGANDVGEVKKQGNIFVYRKQVDEVTLQATVMDAKKHLVTDLARDNFTVYEDNKPQPITSFIRQDIPVSIGIVVDNSGSMRMKRAAVTKAVVNLVQASNPKDEVFIVNFNDEAWLDQDFTNEIAQMREALDRIDSRGGTALYDAVSLSAEHLGKGAQREKKVLLVITDGDDNESKETLEEAIRSVQSDNGPTIYTIGILGEEGNTRRFKRALEAMSVQTGGVAFFPKTLEEVDEISRAVAHDIRNQYSITYKPTNPRANGGYRSVRVEAHAPGYHDLQVRTRSGYYANEQQKTASTNNSTNSK
ncbi:MAG TPA: VWA domain-containing protein [Candidatus Angelobacter sp.]|nr:VWA domain-containing protein [Candidatus Angelobacter sp.]